MLYGYRQLYCSCKSRWYLERYCKDVEKGSDTSNYEIDRPFSKIRNKKVTGLMKDELGGQIMKKIVGLRAETYS